MRFSWDNMTPRQRRRKKRAFLRRCMMAVSGLFAVAIVVLGVWALTHDPLKVRQKEEAAVEDAPVLAVQPELPVVEPELEPEPEPQPVVGLAQSNDDTAHPGDAIGSEYAVLINADTNTVIAEKGSTLAVYPASMTKVLTLLTAAENLEDPEASFTIQQQLIDSHYRAGATITGYRAGDECTLMDLFYGAALRSAADATSGLAIAAAGSEEDFVLLMNDMCAQLELSENAHFTNASGLYNSAHTCTMRDMAAIMRAAMANELCAKVLSTPLYVTPPTASAPEGLTFQNKYLSWFLEKQPDGVEVLACKNGYVAQALNCLVSYGVNAAGEHFICVTAKGRNAETMMGDHRMLYSTYAKAQ